MTGHSCQFSGVGRWSGVGAAELGAAVGEAIAWVGGWLLGVGEGDCVAAAVLGGGWVGESVGVDADAVEFDALGAGVWVAAGAGAQAARTSRQNSRKVLLSMGEL